MERIHLWHPWWRPRTEAVDRDGRYATDLRKNRELYTSHLYSTPPYRGLRRNFAKMFSCRENYNEWAEESMMLLRFNTILERDGQTISISISRDKNWFKINVAVGSSKAGVEIVSSSHKSSFEFCHLILMSCRRPVHCVRGGGGENLFSPTFAMRLCKCDPITIYNHIDGTY